jgi:ApeA N-terminal domain 1
VEEREDQYVAEFRIQGRRMSGLVRLKGSESRLELYSDQPIHIPAPQMRTIRGLARTGERITVCDAVGAEIGGGRSYYDRTQYFADLFAHFVAVGPRHLDTDRRVISEIHFTTTEATSLFYDHGAFGIAKVKNVRRLMPAWARKDRREIRSSQLFYYADRGPIFAVKTRAIEFEAFNGISYRMPSPRGISLTNELRIALKFKRPVKLSDAIKAIFEFRAFCEIVSHSKHCIRNIMVRHTRAEERESLIRLYPADEEAPGDDQTDFRDNLVSAGMNRKEFEQVLGTWMERQQSHVDARLRIVQGIRQGRLYTVDRLVGAANAFDLLPGALYAKPKVPADVRKILADLTSKAKTLKPPYRDQILSNLNRVKSLTLRQKIESRFRSLPLSLRKRLPEMEFLIDHCVRIRNYYVHGSKPKLPLAAIRDFLFLFTDTLEFIFATSELAECGWNVNRWMKWPGGRAKFKDYLRSYERALNDVKNAAGSSR